MRKKIGYSVRPAKFRFNPPGQVAVKSGSIVPPPITLGASFFITVAPAYCTSDSGHTTPCTDGSSIASWYEQISETWVNWVNFGSTVKPIFHVSGSKYYADFNPVNNATYQFPDTWPQNDVTFVLRFTPQANVGQVVSSGGDSGNTPYSFYRATKTGSVQRFNTGPSGALTNGSDTVMTYTATGTSPTSTEKMRMNGGAWVTVSNARPSRTGTSKTLDVGFGSAGGNYFTNFKGMAIFPAVLPDAQALAVENYFLTL